MKYSIVSEECEITKVITRLHNLQLSREIFDDDDDIRFDDDGDEI